MKWERVELGEVAEVIAGQSPPSKYYNQDGEGLPFFQGKADFNYLFPDVRYWCTKPTKISEPGDILFSVRAPVGPTNLNKVQACIGRGLSAIRPSEKIDLKFLLYFFRYMEPRISDKATGSTFKAITQKTLKSLKIPLPPLPEQRRLAARLDKADALRQKSRAVVEAYAELGRSVFLEVFGDPVRNERGWEVVELEKLISIQGGYAFKSTDFIEKGIPVIKIGTVNKGFFDTNTLSFLPKEYGQEYQKWIVKPQDLLVSLTGTVGKDDYGNIEIATNDYPSYLLNQRVARLDLIHNKINPKFLYHAFKQNGIKQKLTKLSRGVRQANISNKDILSLEIINPPLNLQTRFARMVANIEAQRRLAERQLEAAEAVFGGVLQGTFG
jgi:type I restriction enzyme S subunit